MPLHLRIVMEEPLSALGSEVVVWGVFINLAFGSWALALSSWPTINY
jgi:hypothetical protein